MGDGRINITARMDASQAQKEADKLKLKIHGVDVASKEAGSSIDDFANKAAGLAAGAFSVGAISNFVKKIYEVRSSFQDAESSLSVFLGSAEKGQKFFKELKDYAWFNMFEFSDLLEASTQLIAFGNATEDVIPIIDRLSNIASGTKKPLEEYVELWNKAKSQQKASSDELISWANHGVVVKDILAEMGEKVDGNTVSFSQLQKAINHVTDDGGMFAGLMESQMDNLSASTGQLADDFDAMLNELGEKFQGTMKWGIETASKLINNYETIGKVLVGLVATFGTYKAALFVINSLEKIKSATLLTNIRLTAMYTKELGFATAAQQAFNLASKANVYVALASAVIGVTAALFSFSKKQKEAVRTSGEAAQKISQETNELDQLMKVAKNEKASKEERKNAIETINAKYGDYLDNLLTEKDSVDRLTQAYKQLSGAIAQKYLEQMKESMVGEKQSAFDDAEESYWVEVKKILSGSNLSSGQQGRLTAEMQNWMTKFSKSNNAGEVYNAIKGMMDKYGLSMSNRQSGNLYSAIWDYKDTQYQLSVANKDFNQFANGYKDALNGMVDTSNQTSGEVARTLQDIVAEITKADSQIAALRKKAASSGLTKDDKAQLDQLLSQSDASKKEYKSYTGKEYGKGSEKVKDVMDKYTKQLDEFNQQMTRKAVQTQWDIRNAEIDAMEDGYTKEMEKVKQEHTEKLERLAWNYEDELEKIEEQEREIYKQKHNGSDAGFKFDAENNARAIALRKQYYSEVDAETVDFLASSGKLEDDHSKLMLQHLNEYLKQYGNLEARKLAISKDYDEKIRKARKEGDEGLAKSLEAQKNSEIFALEKEYSGLYALIFADAQNLTNSQLGKAIEATQEEIKKASESGDIDKLTELYERLRSQLEVNSSRSSGWGFFGIINGFKDMEKAAKDYEKAVKAGDKEGAFNALSNQQNADNAISKGFDEVFDSFDKLGSAMSSFGGTIGEIGEGLSNLASNLSGVYSAIKSGDKGSIISTAITGVLSLTTTIGNQIQENKKYQEEWNRTIEQCAHEYQMLQLEQYEYQQQNIFGVENPYKKAIDNAELYRQSMTALIDMQNKLAQGQVQTGTKKVVDGGNVGVGVGAGAAAGAAIGTAIGGWALGIGTVIGTAIGALVGGLTSAFAAKKVVPVFEGLLTQYGYLYDEKTYELNPQILADYDKLDEDTKQIVDNWNDIKDKALEAEQQMRDTFSDMAGDIGTQLSDALVEAFRNKDLYDAIGDFHDTMTGTIEDIIEQLVFATTFGDMFDELEKRMFDSFGVKGDGSIVDDLAWMENEYQKRLSQYDEGMKQAQETMERLGYNLWSSDEKERTGYTKTGIQASQDSVDKGTAILTTMQGHTYEINQNTREIKEQNAAMQRMNASILEELQGIHRDTTSLGDQLGVVVSEVKSMHQDVSKMNNYGVIIRR